MGNERINYNAVGRSRIFPMGIKNFMQHQLQRARRQIPSSGAAFLMPPSQLFHKSLTAIQVAKNHIIKANAAFTNEGLAFAVTLDPTAEPMMQATDVIPISK